MERHYVRQGYFETRRDCSNRISLYLTPINFPRIFLLCPLVTLTDFDLDLIFGVFMNKAKEPPSYFYRGLAIEGEQQNIG